MKSNKLQKQEVKILVEKITEAKEDARSLAISLFKNLIGFIPIYGPALGAASGILADYYDAKVTKKRKEEVNACIQAINKRLTGVEIRQEATDYIEKSIVFRLEEITIKLITNPGKGFDEVIAEFVANALIDLKTPPETKDLILSTLLNLDSIDVLVLKTMDKHFLSNLKSETAPQGVTRDSISTLLKEAKIDEAVINRSLQRLQSEYLIQPMKVSAPALTAGPTSDELYNGKRPDQYDAPGGYVNTDFGRLFIKFLKLSE